MARELTGSAVVITGASSGIGRAAAVAFAREGARVALAARSGDALEALAQECRRAGGEAIAVPTDVTAEDAVERLAQRTVEAFDRIDVWVNGAGVILYGRFEDIPSDDFRRVIETNFFGQVHGARAAIRRFRRQGSGVLINMSSVWGRVETPFVSPYVASKFAVRALSETLRYELQDCPGVRVSTILPQAVDTPIFDHAANYSGRRLRPIPPLEVPYTVAEGIVRCAVLPKNEVTYSHAGRALELMRRLTPRVYARIAPGIFSGGTFADAAAPKDAGNLFEPAPDAVTGGWRARRRRVLAQAFVDALRGMVLRLRGRVVR